MIRSKLRIVFYFFFYPNTIFIFRGFAKSIFIIVLGAEFVDVSSYDFMDYIFFAFMVWSRINIIFSRAINFEIN